MTFVSYAQNFEDVLLWRVFRMVSKGFYIDVGAAHPDTNSVTRAFYDRGWRGINVEPVPELYGRLCAARPRDINLRQALGSHEEPGTVYVLAGKGPSTVDATLAELHRSDDDDVRAQDAPVTTLTAICREHAPETVHFLKIDVEGAEGAVLEGADFATCRPWIVVVEATAPGTTVATHAEWEHRLVDAGYRFLYFDGLNRFYAASERFDAVSPHFRSPVCAFDDFVRAADSEWARRISHAEMQAADLLERSLVADDALARAEHRAHDAEMRARRAEDRILPWEQRADTADARTKQTEIRLLQAEAMLQMAESRLAMQANEAQRQLATLRSAQEDAASLRASTSWRLTAPVRQASILARVVVNRGRVAANALKRAWL